MLGRPFIVAVFIAAGFYGVAGAETFTTINDLDRRPVAQIASELGVTPQQFADCFTLVEPARNFKPTKARERANKAKLLPCLQNANSALTNKKLDRVMDKYRGRQN